MAASDSGGVPTSPAAELVRENIAKVLWRSRWIAWASVGTSLLIGFIYVNRMLPVYTSTSKIYVEPSGPRILTEAEGVMTQSKNYLYTQAELLKSTPILMAALKRVGTKQLQVFEKVDNPAGYLKQKGLDISVGKKDDIISISFDSPDPCEAAEFVNAVVDSYIAYHATRKRSTTSEVLRVLQQEKHERDKELSQKLKAMMEFKSRNNSLAFEHNNSNIILSSLAQLSSEMRQAQIETIEAGSAFEIVKSLAADPDGLKQLVAAEMARGVCTQAADERAKLNAELEDLQVQLDALDQRITSDHPWMRTLQQKIARVQQKLEELDTEFVRAHLAIAKQRYEAAVVKEKQICAYFEEQRGLAIELNRELAEYRILQSDWEQTKKLCDVVDERIREINATEDVACLYISVLEFAQPSTFPSGPPKAKYMTFALLVGIMLAVGLAVLRDYADQRLRSVEEISAALGVPVFGSIPSIPRRLSVAARGLKVFLDPGSSWAEAYRRICTEVLFGMPESRARTILITSPTVAEDRSTLASNLAIAIAQAGQKTLLVDADFPMSIQHKVFDIGSGDVGLSTVLAGATPSAEATQPTQVKSLDLLPCGPDLPNRRQALNSDRIGELLDILADRYDRIVVDSPPALPVNDAMTLAAVCDTTVVVVAANKSPLKTALQARNRLLSAGARTIGVVLDDVSVAGNGGPHSTFARRYGSDHLVRSEVKSSGKAEAAAAALIDRSSRYAVLSDRVPYKHK